MICPNCGKEIENDVAVCKYCGTPVNLTSSYDDIEKVEIVEDNSQEDSDASVEEFSENKAEAETNAETENISEDKSPNTDNDISTEPFIEEQGNIKSFIKNKSKEFKSKTNINKIINK